jgi:reactive intermediate/imine deaminase
MLALSHWLEVFTAAGFAVPLALAAASGKRGTRRHMNLPGRSHSYPFSDAVQVGETLYLSGRIGFDPATSKPAAKVEDEARLVLDGIRQVLAEAGMNMNDLVSVQVFCPDVSLFETFNGVYRHFFNGELSARAFLGSGPLLFGARFEVQGIAVRRKSTASGKRKKTAPRRH